MALAAKFPLKSRCKNSEFIEQDTCAKHEDSSIPCLDGISKLHEQTVDKQLQVTRPLVAGGNKTTNNGELFSINNINCTIHDC